MVLNIIPYDNGHLSNIELTLYKLFKIEINKTKNMKTYSPCKGQRVENVLIRE